MSAEIAMQGGYFCEKVYLDNLETAPSVCKSPVLPCELRRLGGGEVVGHGQANV